MKKTFRVWSIAIFLTWGFSGAYAQERVSTPEHLCAIWREPASDPRIISGQPGQIKIMQNYFVTGSLVQTIEKIDQDMWGNYVFTVINGPVRTQIRLKYDDDSKTAILVEERGGSEDLSKMGGWTHEVTRYFRLSNF